MSAHPSVPAPADRLQFSLFDVLQEGTFLQVLAQSPNRKPIISYVITRYVMAANEYKAILWQPLAHVHSGFSVYAVRRTDYVEEPIVTRAQAVNARPSAYLVVPHGGYLVADKSMLLLSHHKDKGLSMKSPSDAMTKILTDSDSNTRSLYASPPLSLIANRGVFSAALSTIMQPQAENLLMSSGGN